MRGLKKSSPTLTLASRHHHILKGPRKNGKTVGVGFGGRELLVLPRERNKELKPFKTLAGICVSFWADMSPPCLRHHRHASAIIAVAPTAHCIVRVAVYSPGWLNSALLLQIPPHPFHYRRCFLFQSPDKNPFRHMRIIL